MARSYGSKLIFPEHIFESIEAGGEALTDIVATRGSEVRNRGWTQRRRRISLSGITLRTWQKDELDLFQEYTSGRLETFLFRDTSRSRMEMELIGTGNGSATAFQLKTSRAAWGRSPFAYTVRWPDHNYPLQQLATGVQSWPRGTIVTPPVTLYGKAYDGYIHLYKGASPETATEISRDDFTVNRENSGVVTLDTALPNGVNLYASGFFYTLVRFDADYIPVQALGGGSWKISEGALVEPKGGN